MSLRDAVAAAALAALDDPNAIVVVEALTRALARDTTLLPTTVAARLDGLGVFTVDAALDGRTAKVALRHELSSNRDVALERVRRAIGAAHAFWKSRRGLPADPIDRALAQAAALWDAGLFFEVHEILERQWRVIAAGPLRGFLQGMIQIAAGLHHVQGGKPASAQTLVDAGCRKVALSTPRFRGVDVDALLASVRSFMRTLEVAGEPRRQPMFPTWPAAASDECSGA